MVVFLAPAYDHREAERLRYTALSRARHRVFVLESAIPEPARPRPAAAPVPALPAESTAPPPRPRPVQGLGAADRLALMDALKAARQGPNRKRTGAGA